MRDVAALLEDEQRQTDHAGNTTLHQACYQNQSEVAEVLIRAGRMDLDAPNDAGETPLLLACQNQNVYLTEILLKAGADPNQTKSYHCQKIKKRKKNGKGRKHITAG